MRVTIYNKLLLKKYLFGLCMRESMLLKDHIDEMYEILMKLRDMDTKLEVKDFVTILLVSFFSSLTNFVNSLSIGR